MIATEAKYKKTGIDWMPEIPEHWNIVRLKNVSKIVNGATPKSSVAANWDGNINWITPAEFGNEMYIGESVRKITKTGLKSCAASLVPIGSIILSSRAPIGSLGIANVELCTNQGCRSIVPANVNNYFLYFLLIIQKDNLNVLGNGTTFRELGTDSLKNYKIPLPPKEEQVQIATFLLQEYHKIARFIQTKERFIELLKEQRQSIITHSVTKGIDENVKMKETGIDWMQKIPEHWQVSRIRYLGGFQNGLNKNQEAFGSGFPFISYSDVYQNELLPNNPIGLANVDKIERERHSVRSGDIFFTRTSETIEEIGFSSVCIDTINDATFSGFLIRFRPIEGLLSPYFSQYYFRCQVHRAFFVKEMMLVTRASLSQDLLKNLPVLLPPIDEQIKIAKYIKTETRVLDIAISKAEREIELIKEYREAMIAEAVTGKLL